MPRRAKVWNRPRVTEASPGFEVCPQCKGRRVMYRDYAKWVCGVCHGEGQVEVFSLEER